MRSSALMAAAAVMVLAAPVVASAQDDWRTVPPENLLVIDTVKGRILVELDPRVAPQSVNRIRTLADQGFYDGLKFHRVIPNFMAQTGDPEGTGGGGSDLPDLNAEFEFRRGRADGFYPLVAGSPQYGLIGSIPVQTQPDAQMMITADFKTPAVGQFCPGVAGMARTGNDVNSANSQFFLMTGARDNLNGQYTVFGRVLSGLEVVRALNAGSEADNGAVADPDIMTRTRTAAAMPAVERPAVRVMNTTSAAFSALVEQTRAERGARFSVCDVQPPAELVD